MAVVVGDTRVLCDVAQTSQEQARGLQGREPLAADEGMLFPFTPPRAATFHMGSVAFPIDIVFADAAGRVGRIVHQAEPGSRARWTHPASSAVVELQGGACAREGIDIGQLVRVYASRHQAQVYNLPRSIVEADPLLEGYYTKEPLDTTTPSSSVPPEERFRDRRVLDDAPLAMDQPNPHFRSQQGFQPTTSVEDAVGPSVRMTAQIADPGQFVASIIEAMARVEKSGQPALRWQPDILNSGATESAIITRADVQEWLDRLELDPTGQRAALSTATSPDGLQLLADGLVLAGVADLGRILGHHVVLFRGRR